jgi:hypothetical protein
MSTTRFHDGAADVDALYASLAAADPTVAVDAIWPADPGPRAGSRRMSGGGKHLPALVRLPRGGRGLSTPVTCADLPANTSSWACSEKSEASQLYTLTSATTHPADPSTAATAADTSTIVRSVDSYPPYRLGRETSKRPALEIASMHSSATRRSVSPLGACSRSSGRSACAWAASPAAVHWLEQSRFPVQGHGYRGRPQRQ